MVRRILAALAALTVLMIGCATAEKFVAADGDDLYIAAGNALLRVTESDAAVLQQVSARNLQAAGGRLYYAAYTEDETGSYLQPFCVNPADGACTALADRMPIGTDYEYDGNYSQLITCTTRYGYRDLTVCGDYIYYIGDDGQSGSYVTECTDWNGVSGKSAFRTEYESAAAVYRMGLNGEKPFRLIAGLGNGANVHMAVEGDQIVISTCWQNAVYAYDFANFQRYDTNGRLLYQAENHSQAAQLPIRKSDQAFTAIVEAIHPRGDVIYASFGDSEGDFASARLADVENPDVTVAYEALYAQSAVCDRGIVYVGSELKAAYWDELLEETLTVNLRTDDGEIKLAHIPREYAAYGMIVNVAGDMAYVRIGDNVIRVPLAGGMPQMLGAGGFADCDTFCVENY